MGVYELFSGGGYMIPFDRNEVLSQEGKTPLLYCQDPALPGRNFSM